MERLRIVYLLLISLSVFSNAAAQSEDWQVLRSLPAGSKIKVTLKHRRTFGHCRLEGVAEDWLGCYFTSLGYRRYARDDIREVRLGHHTARTGLVIGAGTGAILGAINGNAEGAGRVFGAMVLAPVLGGIGAGVGAVVDPFRQGKAVYRSRDFKAPPPVAP